MEQADGSGIDKEWIQLVNIVMDYIRIASVTMQYAKGNDPADRVFRSSGA